MLGRRATVHPTNGPLNGGGIPRQSNAVLPTNAKEFPESSEDSFDAESLDSVPGGTPYMNTNPPLVIPRQSTTIDVRVSLASMPKPVLVEAWATPEEELPTVHVPVTPESDVSEPEEGGVAPKLDKGCRAWYSPFGKNPLVALSLLVVYVIFGILFFPIIIIILMVSCVSYFTPEIE